MSTAFAAAASPFGQPSNAAQPGFGAPSLAPNPNLNLNQPRQPSPTPIANPFAPSPKPQQSALPNAAAPSSSPFGVFTNALSDGSQIGVTKPNPFASLKNNSNSTGVSTFGQQSGAPKPNPFDALKNNKPERQPSPAAPAPSSFGSGAKKTVHFAHDVQTNTIPNTMAPPSSGAQGRFAPQPSEGTKQLSSLAVDYAQKVHARLRTDRLSAPRWPSDPGNPAQRPAMEKLKESYKQYRAKAYESLRKAEIIDDPERKRRLEDALTFKGICEDMCPDYEQVTRICEYDVKKEEKRPGPSGGEPWAEPSKMVKKFARSAAGIEEPLPMDVRSMDALKRSTDYLLGDLLKTDDQLPSLHGYLWDRTRAVRKDFSFHSQKSSGEMQVMVYILETIARFHVVSLHLLSKKGVASDDFDQQQEVQQLGATLLSLNETYDDCRPRGLVCDNEAEFRALFLLLNKGDAAVVEKSLEWASQPWYNSTHMENAKSLLASLQSFDEVTGPFNPRALGTHFAATGFTKFFDLVGSKTVSYTMACMCEIHFTWLRQRILQTLVKGFARRRDWPKDITPRVLNRMLRFDTAEEAIEFAELHGFKFETRAVDGRQEQYLLLNSKRQHVPSPRVPQSHSAAIVEAKRNGQPLAEVVRKSIYGEKDIEFQDGESDGGNVLADNTQDNNMDSDDGDDMFVGQSMRKVTEKQGQTQQPPVSFGSNSNPFGAHSAPPSAPKASPSAPKTSPFAPVTTANATQPPNGISQNGTTPRTTATAPQPAVPAANPFLQHSPQPSAAFGKPTPAAQPPAAKNEAATPAAQPAKAPETSPFSFLGALQKQSQAPPASGTSVFPDLNKTSSPFQSSTPGGNQSSAPTTTTPSTVNKDNSTVGAKTTTPQSSVFSSLASAKSTPPSGSIFPTSTPAASASSGVKPSATTTTPATSTFSTAGSGDATKSTPAASVFAQPAAPSGSTSATAQSKPSRASSQNVQKHAAPTSRAPASLPPSSAPPPAANPMEGFTRWFVQGDGGLLEEFRDYMVEDIVAAAFQQFQAEEAERKRREEDEASWAAAREHMAYRLGVKFFYRWRETARQRAMARILREGKVKYKAAMEAKYKSKREQKAKEKKAAERKKRDEIWEREDRLRNFTAADELERIIAENQRSRQSSAEEALLASGVFNGVRNEKAVARRVVQEAYLPRPASSQSSMTMLPPPPVEAAPPVKKEGWKTRSLREKFSMSQRRDSFSSGGTGGTSNFSQSLPVVVGGGKVPRLPKITNFSASISSRKRSADASDDEPDAKKSKKILNSGLSLHWELRKRGLLQMPDGQWLPERIATQLFEGKRFAGYGDYGLGPGKVAADDQATEDTSGKVDAVKHKQPPSVAPSDTGSKASKLETLARRFGFPPTRRYHGRGDSVASGSSYNATPTSVLSSSPGAAAGRRKHDVASPNAKDANVIQDIDTHSSDDESQGEHDGLTSTQKVDKALARIRRQMRELNENMDVLDAEDRPWMREEMERMRREGSGLGPGQGQGQGQGKGPGRLNGGVRDEGGL